jgi:hypothetical protein
MSGSAITAAAILPVFGVQNCMITLMGKGGGPA